MKFNPIYEDEDIIAFNKPSGMLSIPDRYNSELPNLYKEVSPHHGQLFLVHRIDKDTSGLMCFAKHEQSHKYMSQLFENRQIEKYYRALVHGHPLQPSGSITAPIAEHLTHKGRMVVQPKGRASRTDYETVESWKGYALLRLQLHTGRTHQIRVHLQFLGHPIVCDPFYGDGKPLLLSSIKKRYKHSGGLEEEERPLLARLALHASELIFTNEKGQHVHITAPLSKDMEATIKQLNKWASL